MADLRLADLLAALSEVTDLGMGQPSETATRCCWLATNLARRMGIDERAIGDIYYTTLLQHVGCTAYAHETAALFGGDDNALRANGSLVDSGNVRELLGFLVFGIGKGAPPRVRMHAVVDALRLGASFDEALSRSNCEIALRVVDRIGLGTGVREGLDHIYERWDGKGNLHKLKAEQVALPARFAHVASQAIQFHRLGGVELALDVVGKRSGGLLDPGIAGEFLARGRLLLDELERVDPALAVLDAEPEPYLTVRESRLDGIARAFADMVDVKSPYTHGHSTAVSRLAAEAASGLGLPDVDIAAIRRAGYLHDLGHAGIPNGIWDKPGSLTTTEWEQVRLHPYYSERIVMRSVALSPLAPLVGMHHERQDGTGYPHQARGHAIPIGARILAAANIYQAMTEERPHRPAHTPGVAAEQLRLDAKAGRLDGQCVNAVLEAAGHARRPARHTWPANLTRREVDVLRLAARGRSNKQIGAALSISPKTADHHIQHIYTKIGVSTRAGAAMFAMEHGLIFDDGVEK